MRPVSSQQHKKILQVGIELSDLQESLELKWDGHDLRVQSPTNAKVTIRVADSELPNIAKSNKQSSVVHSRNQSSKDLTKHLNARNVKAAQSHPPTVSKKVTGKVVKGKGKKRISRKRQGEMAMHSMSHLFSQKQNLGFDRITDELLKDVRLLYVNHPVMNEKALCDISLMAMNAQYDRFEKRSVLNEEWHYTRASQRTRGSAADKRSRNLSPNQTPIHGVFDIAYDQYESNLEFIRFLFTPFIESESYIPSVKHLLAEKSFIDDATLSCVPLLFQGKLRPIIYSENTKVVKPSIVHHNSEPKIRSSPVSSFDHHDKVQFQRLPSLPKLQGHNEKHQNAPQSFQKRVQSRP